MLPTNNVGLFEAILKDFDDNGILQDFILIGSWVLRVYSEHFNNDPQVPIVATQDLDLLVTNPPKVSREVNITKILSKYDLEEASNPWDSNSKFVGPDFEVEFLIPEKGRGESKGRLIKGLGITATPLRYMNFIQDHAEPLDYKGLSIRVPNPAVFVLMKYLLIKKRKKTDTIKIAKDISTAKDLEFFLLDNGKKEDFIFYFKDMSKGWRKDLLLILEANESELFDIFKNMI